MNELRIDSFCRRRVSPFDGSSSLVVVPDVTKDFSSEIVDGGKDASGDNLPLNLGEPDFDLVKPRRIGGCKMHADLGMMGQKVLEELGFMGREVIRDDVDLASEGLGGHDIGKKVDKLGAGMALSGLATRCRCQLVRMPGGDRQNGAPADHLFRPGGDCVAPGWSAFC